MARQRRAVVYDALDQRDRDDTARAVKETPKLSRKKPLIERVREVKANGYARVDGLMLDVTTAHAILTVHDALNAENQAHFAALPLRKMVDVTWKLLRKG